MYAIVRSLLDNAEFKTMVQSDPSQHGEYQVVAMAQDLEDIEDMMRWVKQSPHWRYSLMKAAEKHVESLHRPRNDRVTPPTVKVVKAMASNRKIDGSLIPLNLRVDVDMPHQQKITTFVVSQRSIWTFAAELIKEDPVGSLKEMTQLAFRKREESEEYEQQRKEAKRAVKRIRLLRREIR